MAFLPVLGVAQVDVNWTLHAQLCQTTFYAGQIGVEDVSNADVDEVAEILRTWLEDEWFPIIPSAVTGRTVVCRSLEQAVTYEKTVDISTFVGGDTATAAPGNVVLAIQRTANLTGRSSRGRIYAPLANASVSGNMVSSTVAATYVNTLNSLESAIHGYGANWYGAIVSRIPGGGLTPKGSWLPVDHWQTTDLALDSQRRRLAGRGA